MLAILYNSVTLSMLISVGLFLNEWIEMRVNIGWIFFGVSGLFFLLQTVIKPLRKFCATFTASASSLIISCSGISLLLDTDSMKIIPASIIREGLMINRVPFATINAAMIAFAVIGLILIYVTRKRK